MSQSESLVVGWREWVHLPSLGVRMVKAKVDTGARTSSLHAENIRILRRGRRDTVAFTVYPQQRSRLRGVEAEAPLLELRWVRSSNGTQELRPVVQTVIDIGGHCWEIELTLSRRDVMGFRMLLGRQALRGHAVVDPARSFLTRKAKKKKKSTSERPPARGRGSRLPPESTD